MLGSSPPQLVGAVPGPRSRELIEVLARSESPALTARRARRAEKSGAPQDPIVWRSARGANVVDVDGNVFVDLAAGFGVMALGHADPRIQAAIAEQATRVTHGFGDVHPSDVKVELLERLASLAPFEDARVILGSHGSDAIEAALKTAALHTKRPGVLAFEGGYHGLSHGPLAISAFEPRFREPFAAQLNPHVTFAPWPADGESVEAALAAVERAWGALEIGAVFVEPMQGRGGFRPAPPGFIAALGQLAHARGALLVLDEIMMGLGRAGALWLGVHEGASPDLICAGKALGGGMPMSACLGREEVMRSWGDPEGAAIHTATFLGHPLACAASLAFLDALDEDALASRSATRGEALLRALGEKLQGLPKVRAVRGRGMAIGVAFSEPMLGVAMMSALLRRGFITLPAARDGSVLSLTPPLSLPDALASLALDAIADAARELCQ